MEGIAVPPFEAPGNLAGQEAGIIAQVLDRFEDRYRHTGIVFTLVEPAADLPYSTVFIGGDDTPFRKYGRFFGLSEKNDAGKADLADNAFVFSANIHGDEIELGDYVSVLDRIVLHEVHRLLGQNEPHPIQPGDGPLDHLAHTLTRTVTRSTWHPGHYENVGCGLGSANECWNAGGRTKDANQNIYYEGNLHWRWHPGYYTYYTETITVANDPPTVTLEGPSEGTTGRISLLDLNWSGFDPNGCPITYTLYVGRNANVFAAPEYTFPNLTGTSFPVGNINAGLPWGTYYWGVRVTDHHGAFENSSVRSFYALEFGPWFKAGSVRILNWDDRDLDGYARSFDLEFDVDTNWPGNYRVIAILAGETVATSPFHPVSGQGDDPRTIHIEGDAFSDTVRLDGPLSLMLVDEQGTFHDAFDPSHDPDFGVKRLEPSRMDTTYISGIVWEDANGNGVRDPGEGIAGRHVYLDLNKNGQPDPSETFVQTDADGRYFFPDLTIGVYWVGVVMDAAWQAITPANARQRVFLDGPYAASQDYDFRLQRAGADVLADLEIRDGDVAFDVGGPGTDPTAFATVRNIGSAPAVNFGISLREENTSAGVYPPAVRYLAPGDETVVALTWPTSGLPVAVWVTVDPDNLIPEDREDNNRVRAYCSGTDGGLVSGTLWHDRWGTGERAADDPPLAGWTVRLGAASSVTDSAGRFWFEALAVGSHTVTVQAPVGWYPTTGPESWTVVIAATDDIHTLDRGFFGAPSSVYGRVFRDNNQNAVDDGEPGAPGFTVWADYNGNGALDGDEPFALTDADGEYAINMVIPGANRLRLEAPGGWLATDADQFGSLVTVLADETYPPDTLTDFAWWMPDAFVMGMVWHDVYNDGDQNFSGVYPILGHDPYLEGATVYVDLNRDGNRDPEEPFCHTDELGGYFLDVPAGQPLDIALDLTSLPGQWRPADTNPTGRLANLVFDAAEARLLPDLAVYATWGWVSGTVFDDLDGDGIHDWSTGGETGLANWTVFLDLNANGIQDPREPIQITDSTGRFSFTAPPGDYLVRQIPRPGWISTTAEPPPAALGGDGFVPNILFGRQRHTGSSLVFRSPASITGNANLPGFDHCGVFLAGTGKVWESHPGYSESSYYDPIAGEQIPVQTGLTGVQGQQSLGSWLEYGGTNSATDALPMDEALADAMWAFLSQYEENQGSTTHLRGYLAVPGFQTGANNSYSAAGLVERAAEEAGINGGEGFVRGWLEWILCPQVIAWEAWLRSARTAFVVRADPVDFILTDPFGRRVGHANGQTYNEIPGARYSGDGIEELVIIPDHLDGVYQLEVFGLGERAWIAVDVAAEGDEFPTSLYSFEGELAMGETLAQTLASRTQAPAPPVWNIAQDTGATSGNLLDNPLGQTWTLGGFTQPARGMVAYNGDGTFTYQPNPGASGTDSFTYEIVSDAGWRETIAMTIVIEDTNDPPVANPDTWNGSYAVPIRVPTSYVLANDTDLDGDPLEVIGVWPGDTGTVALDNGEIVFTPDPDYQGTSARVHYRVADGRGGEATGTLWFLAPEVPHTPTPADGATGVSPVGARLQWQGGESATRGKVIIIKWPVPEDAPGTEP